MKVYPTCHEIHTITQNKSFDTPNGKNLSTIDTIPNRPNRFSIPEREPVFDLAKVDDINEYSFRNKELLRQAFTHEYYKTKECESYERLEYLGDSDLGLGIAKIHFFNYLKMTPGKLTMLK